MNRYGDIDCSFKRLPPVYGFRAEKLFSLEKALQPIGSLIDELPNFIKIAKERCRYPNEYELSKDQSSSIYIYTMEWGETSLYRVLNQALRSENRQALKIWFPYLKLFDTALDRLPTVEKSVWRGVPLDIGKNFTKNQMFTWWSVSSCSSSIDVIQRFLNNENNSTLFLIEIVNGKKISGYTEFENEHEVILKIGTQFRVEANPLKQSDGSHIVHLIEIHDKDQPLATPMKDPTNFHHFQLKSNVKWKPNAKTIADGNGKGSKLNQLYWPQGIFVDDQQQAIYVADWGNDRIVKWKLGENNGQVVAGGNTERNRIDQLSYPTDVIADQSSKSLIMCDQGNRRVVRWSLENEQDKQIIIENIDCFGLMINEYGDLFVSDFEKHEVKRWRKSEKEETIVAGGNGRGNKLNQLNDPRFIFIDLQETVYVSDNENHRVMKWVKGAKEGIVVAGGHGKGNSFNQLSCPEGLIVNEVGDVYVVDSVNDRIMCWSSGSKEGHIVLGGNGRGNGSNQFHYPRGLSFDLENNLYVVDLGNNRIQQFEVDKN